MASARSRPARRADRTAIFLRAVAGTLRAISGRAGGAAASPGVDGIDLAAPPSVLTTADVVRVRGRADAQALRLRHHDERLHALHAPGSEQARAAYEAIEQARVEALGESRMAGVGGNIAAMLDQHCRDRRFDRATRREQVPLAEALRVLARERFCATPPPPAARTMAELWRPFVDARAGPQLEALREHLRDERAFAAGLRELIGALGLDGPASAAQEQRKLARSEAAAGEEDAPQPPQAGGAAVSDAQPASRQASPGRCEGESAAGADRAGAPERADADAGDPMRDRPPPRTQGASYRAYTTAFDQTVGAEALCDASELQRLRARLDRELARLPELVGRLASRLQRRLQARQMRDWAFDLEEGLLDPGRLERIVVSPDHGLSFRMEKASAFRDTVVGLLIDNSSSMRGRPLAVAAMSADILARTLERCGIRVEILGFTTRTWKGGRAREQWERDGQPPAPGRLAEVRHIIYKAADTPWRRARKNLGLMLRDGLPKENIDGEALLWAHRRLLARPEARRILVVVSDGAPADDATLSANPGDYLERHLHEVIAWIEQRSPVELLAIGIGHDVTRHYRRALTLRDADELGAALLEQLSRLFDERV
jgi:cobaltochelatase CobT